MKEEGLVTMKGEGLLEKPKEILIKGKHCTSFKT